MATAATYYTIYHKLSFHKIRMQMMNTKLWMETRRRSFRNGYKQKEPFDVYCYAHSRVFIDSKKYNSHYNFAQSTVTYDGFKQWSSST